MPMFFLWFEQALQPIFFVSVKQLEYCTVEQYWFWVVFRDHCWGVSNMENISTFHIARALMVHSRQHCNILFETVLGLSTSYIRLAIQSLDVVILQVLNHTFTVNTYRGMCTLPGLKKRGCLVWKQPSTNFLWMDVPYSSSVKEAKASFSWLFCPHAFAAVALLNLVLGWHMSRDVICSDLGKSWQLFSWYPEKLEQLIASCYPAFCMMMYQVYSLLLVLRASITMK